MKVKLREPANRTAQPLWRMSDAELQAEAARVFAIETGPEAPAALLRGNQVRREQARRRNGEPVPTGRMAKFFKLKIEPK